MTESRLQHLIIGWLKDKGAYVIKTKPQPGTPTGCPDIIALFGDRWAAIEVKKSENASFRPGQKPTLAYLSAFNGWLVFVCYPDNWPDVKQQLGERLFYK